VLFIQYRSPGFSFFFQKELAITADIFFFFLLQGLSINHSPLAQHPFPDTELFRYDAEHSALLPSEPLSWGSFPGQVPSFHQHRQHCPFISAQEGARGGKQGRCWAQELGQAPAISLLTHPMQRWYLTGSWGLAAVWQRCGAKLGAPGLCNATAVKRFNFFVVSRALC